MFRFCSTIWRVYWHWRFVAQTNFTSEVSNYQILVKKHWNGGSWTFSRGRGMRCTVCPSRVELLFCSISLWKVRHSVSTACVWSLLGLALFVCFPFLLCSLCEWWRLIWCPFQSQMMRIMRINHSFWYTDKRIYWDVLECIYWMYCTYWFTSSVITVSV